MSVVLGRRTRRRSTPATRWLAFGLILATVTTWAAATPMFAAPDEIAHMVRAAAAARGDLDGRTIPGSSARGYRAPAVLVPDGSGPIEGPEYPCFAFNSEISASCLTITGDRGDLTVSSTADGYPPVYYLLVGWPSRLVRGVPGLYAMRFVSAALFAALVAVAVSSIGAGRRTAVARAGLAVALTPMAWFLGGTVSPSSMTIAAGVAVWCGGYRLAVGTALDEKAMQAAAWRFGLPLCLLLLVRRDSILWGGLVVIVLLCLVDRHRARALVRSRAVLGWAVASAVCAAYAASITADSGAVLVTGANTDGSASAALGSWPRYLQECIGIFGWLDTILPWPTYTLVYLVLGALVVTALAVAPRRVGLAIVGVAAMSVAAVVAIGSQRHPYFQGRYGLPFFTGIPILAGLGIAAVPWADRIPARATRIVIGAAAAAHLLAFYQQLRRYAVPGDTTWWLFGDVQWRPPTAPIAALVIANLMAVAAGAVLAERCSQRTSARRASGEATTLTSVQLLAAGEDVRHP